MLGIVSTELNKFEQADKFFKTSLSINAKNPSLYKNYGFFLTRAKQFDKAIEQFNVAIRLFPNSALVYSDRGNAFPRKQWLDLDAAKTEAERSYRNGNCSLIQ